MCEDDIVLRDRFVQRLIETVSEMENEGGLRDYALALFAAYDFEQDASFYRGKRYCSYGYEYYGTPCMYYPKHVALEIRDHMRSFQSGPRSRITDLL